MGMLRSNGILQDSWVMKGAHAFYAYVWGKTESIKYYFSLQKENARLAGFPTDNLEDTFLAMIDEDNRRRGGRA